MGGVRQDLQRVAASLAAKARAVVDGDEPFDSVRVARVAQGAKAALEAAALVEVDPAPILAAIERLEDRLGVQDATFALEEGGPAAAVDAVTGLLEHYVREVAIGAAVQDGYMRLRDLVRVLERDFAAAATPTAARLAARVHAGLEEAEQAINDARKGQQ